MNVYVIRRHEVGYDEERSVAVAAATETEARQIAANDCARRYGVTLDDEMIWRVSPRVERFIREFLDPAASTCEQVDVTVPGVIHWHYQRG